MGEIVYHLNAQVGGRSKGRSAVAAAAYRSGTRLEITSERALASKRIQDYTRRDAVLAEGIMIPKRAPRWMKNREKLWNAVEDSEIRKDAQLFREIDLALPHMLPLEIQQKLLEGFIQQQFVSRGMVADYAIHGPTRHNDERNIHAHIMLTLRDIEADGFGKKNRDWNKKNLLEEWREAWANEVNTLLAANEATREYYVDHRSYKDRGIDQIPTKMLGTKKAMLERMGIRTDVGIFNEKARAYNVERALSRLTDKKAVFRLRDVRETLLTAGARAHVRDQLKRKNKKAKITKAQLDKALDKFLDEEIEKIKKKDLILLRQSGGRFSEFYTTKGHRATEEKQISIAKSLVARKGYGVRDKSITNILEERAWANKKLYADQEKVLRYVTSEGGFKVVEGLAGTGKSFTMSAIRDVYEEEGKRVIGLSHTNTIVQDMAADGFKQAYTISKYLYDLNKPDHIRTLRPPDEDTVLMVDEAAMLSLKQDAQLFDLVQKSGAKLVYIGDSGQLQSIDAGGMFGYYGALAKAERLTTITRQRKEWDRKAAMDFAEGRFFEGLLKYKKHAPDHVTAASNEDLAMKCLVNDWLADTTSLNAKREKRFIFAYTNDQVNELNKMVHQAEIESGIIDPSTLQRFLCARYKQDQETGKREKDGTRSVTLGVNSRIQFRQTNKKLGLFNGSMGKVTGINDDGLITVLLDKKGPRGKIVSFNLNDYSDFDLGYAGTIYKGQGKTFDQAYVLFSKHWRRNAAYVAMTRSRAPTKLYYARNKARSLEILSRQMARIDLTAGVSLAFQTAHNVFQTPQGSFAKAAARRSWMARDFTNSAAKRARQFWRMAQDRMKKAKRDHERGL